MSNPKTRVAPVEPAAEGGWIRKSELDAWLGRFLPVPTQVVSNEEFDPMPQTSEQRQLEFQIVAGAEHEFASHKPKELTIPVPPK